MILKKFKDLSFCQHISEENESMSSGIIRRLSITNSSNDLMRSIESSHTRSLHVFPGDETTLTNEFAQRIPKTYRLLKVLDFEDSQLDFVPENWGNLAHLKYLSLWLPQGKTEILPEFIGRLQNLETLDIRDTCFRVIPKEICKLKKLRHLLGTDMQIFQLKDMHLLGTLGGMTCLQTLHQVNVDLSKEKELVNDDDIVELFRELGKLKQLRNLCLLDVKEELGSVLCSSINEMQNLEKLHIRATFVSVGYTILYCDGIDLPVISSLPMLRKLTLEGKLNKFPEWVPQLQNLVKLSLTHSELIENPLESLQNMPHLMFLYIGIGAYKGESLYFQDGGFQQLKELRLSNLCKLNSIIIEKGALHSLETLKIKEISLKTVPAGIRHLENLEVLDLDMVSFESDQCIAPEGGPEHPNIQHVRTVQMTNFFGTTRVIRHSRH